MKKTLFFVFFLLSILRGPLLMAQTPIQYSSSYTLTDSTCNLRYRLTVVATGGISPYTYILDSLIVSNTGVFNNVNGGDHSLEIRDSRDSVQRRWAYLSLPRGNTNWQVYFQSGTLACDNNGQQRLALSVFGGQAPYRYFIGSDTVGTTVNSFALAQNTVYNILVKDALGCTYYTTLRTPLTNDNGYISSNSLFTPNNCGDSIGTLKVRLVTNIKLTTPLSMSFDGRPFSADSVFTNIRTNRSYPIKIKTQNCGERSAYIPVWRSGPVTTIDDFFTLTNCATQTGRLQIYINGGTPPYRATINGQQEQVVDSNFVTWQNIRVGTPHTIRIVSEGGCELSKTIVLKDRLPFYYDYNTSCGQTRDFKLYSFSKPNDKYQLDNQNPSRDSVSYHIWQNIAQGKHILKLIDSTGCVRTDTITLLGEGGLAIGTTSVNGTCADSLYRLNISGGVPPYTITVNNGTPTTVNNFRLQLGYSYYVEVTDANFCHSANSIYVRQQDSVRVIASVTPQSCNLNTLRLTVSASDTTVARPLSMSLDGRPFSTDTIFQNVVGGRVYAVLLKSKRGCDLRSSVSLVSNSNIINVYFVDSCGSRAGSVFVTAYPTGGSAPYRYIWSNGSTTATLRDVASGQYSVTITDANGCVSTKTITTRTCGGTALQINISSTRTDSICNFKYRVVATAGGGTPPYTFRLDSLYTSATGIFNNVYGGLHSVEVFDANGQRQQAYISLNNGNSTIRAGFYGISGTCDTTNQSVYALNVNGGQPPYRFYIGRDTVGTTTNSFPLAQNTVYNVLIKDATGCQFNASLLTPPAYDNNYLYANAVFTPNNCGDSIGKIQIKLSTNLRLTTPLSMSFAGSPFSADSVFTNVIANTSYTVKVKTQSCGERTTSVYPYSVGHIRNIGSHFALTNCSAQKGRLTIWWQGGASPFRISVSGQEQTVDSLPASFENVSVGIHHVRIRSADSCDFTYAIVAKDKLMVDYNYDAICGQGGNFRIYRNPNVQGTYKLDNQSPSRDTGFYFNWQNIAQGRHFLEFIDSAGCNQTDSITLYGVNGLTVRTTRTGVSCADTIQGLSVSGGVPPYTYSVNSSTPTTVNDFKLKVNNSYYVEITDANYCRFSNYIYTYASDSVRVVVTTGSQLCNGTTTSLTLSVPDTNAARPLSISFDGRPFAPDTVFQNVQGGRSYSVLVKSKQGCNLRTSIYVPISNSAVSVYMYDSCATRLGRGSLWAYTAGGVSPYRYQWSNGATTVAINDAPIGTYFVTVTDANGCTATRSANIISCVWSGDTDTSGVVDNRDLLNIGLAFGEIGPKRCPYDSLPNQQYCTYWAAQKAAEWSKQTPARTNFKHIDTNGDGIINSKDTLAIFQNWNKIHQLRAPQTTVVTERSVVPPISIQTSNVGEGQWASFPILLGDATATADNVYGLAFSVKYPPSVIEPNSLRLVVNQSWLGASSELLNVFKDEVDNVFHVGLVKTNKLNVTGNGQIATLMFKLKAGTKGTDLQFGVYNDFLINNNGAQLTSIGKTTTVKITTDIAEPYWANQIMVYPNPTRDDVTIEAQNVEIQSITVLDIAGKVIEKTTLNHPLPIVSGSAISIKTVGTYFLKIETNKGTVMKKVVRL